MQAVAPYPYSRPVGGFNEEGEVARPSGRDGGVGGTRLRIFAAHCEVESSNPSVGFADSSPYTGELWRGGMIWAR